MTRPILRRRFIFWAIGLIGLVAVGGAVYGQERGGPGGSPHGEASSPSGDEIFAEANAHYQRGDYSRAAAQFQASAEAYIVEEDPVSAGHTFAWAASAFWGAGEVASSILAYQRAASTLEAAGDLVYAAVYRNSLASVYLHLGRLNEAEGELARGYQLLLTVRESTPQGGENPYLEEATPEQIAQQFATIALYLGDTRNRLFDHAKAIAPLEEVLRVYDEGLPPDDRYLNALYGLGYAYRASGAPDAALETYDRAVAFTAAAGRVEDQIQIYQLQSATAIDAGSLDQGLDYAQQAYDLAQSVGAEQFYAPSINNIGSVYQARGEYATALEYFEEGVALYRRFGDRRSEAMGLNNIAFLYDTWGYLDQAAANYRRSMEIAEEEGFTEDIPTYRNNLGLVYLKWGAYDEAERWFTAALTAAEETSQINAMSNIHSSLGNLALKREQLDTAQHHFETALEIDLEANNPSKIAVDYTNLGTVAQSLGDTTEAVTRYHEALALAREQKLPNVESTALNNIGNAYKDEGRFDDALAYYEQALEIDRRLADPDALATLLTNIGGIYYRIQEWENAQLRFTESISLLERLRSTAPGAVRREYLAAQIHTYSWLTATLVRMNRTADALEAAEAASARYLEEQLRGGDRTVELTGTALDIDRYTSEIPGDTTVIVYTNVGWSEPVTFIGTSGRLRYAFYSHGWNDGLLAEDIKRGMERTLRRIRGRLTDSDPLGNAIAYYRYLLSRPLLRGREAAALEVLSRGLYDHFIKPIEGEIPEGTRELLIVPDGPLALIPFETLRDTDGRYLVERFDLRYTHSLQVEQLVRQRTYSEDRASLIAFGGAVYDPDTYTSEPDRAAPTERDAATTAPGEDEVTRVRSAVTAETSRGITSEAGNHLAALGYTKWENLPGSLTEVQTLAEIVPNAQVFTGDAVTEDTVTTTDLSQYAVVHFATHGIVVPEVPELSSLVLSQNTAHDGYLSVPEIGSLQLKADLVTLSACQTGLGALYPGEGVVGLNQAFLVAGANGIISSLWSVSDRSTTQFMIETYRAVFQEGVSFSRAVNLTKRSFLEGDEFRAPYYWAPFVYYGK